jgi:hypothetical protein
VPPHHSSPSLFFFFAFWKTGKGKRRQKKLLRTVQKPSSPASAGKLHALPCSLQPEKENVKDKLLKNIKYQFESNYKE